MILLPAIDLYNGQCVRLAQGKFDQMTVYFKDPLEPAKKWAAAGATWLHVVDLNGALEGKPINFQLIKKIIQESQLFIEVGGGIRDEKTVHTYLDLGVMRVILGSVALEKPDLVKRLCQNYPGKIGIGIDAKGGKVATRGWVNTSKQEAISVAQEFASCQPACIVYTDIARDGMLTGPNFPALKKMVKAVKVPIIASGGIASLEDLKKLNGTGVIGAILGRSLYEGKIDLAEAISLFAG